MEEAPENGKELSHSASVATDTVTVARVATCLLSDRRIVVHEIASKFRIKVDPL